MFVYNVKMYNDYNVLNIKLKAFCTNAIIIITIFEW